MGQHESHLSNWTVFVECFIFLAKILKVAKINRRLKGGGTNFIFPSIQTRQG